MKNNGMLDHVTPTQWFIGACEVTSCENTSVIYDKTLDMHVCWAEVTGGKWALIHADK